MKKWLIIYVLLIIVIGFFIKSTDIRQYKITDIKLSSYKTELTKDNPNISDEEVKQKLESKFFWDILKKSFILASGIMIFAFLMTCLRNSFISEFLHFRI